MRASSDSNLNSSQSADSSAMLIFYFSSVRDCLRGGIVRERLTSDSRIESFHCKVSSRRRQLSSQNLTCRMNFGSLKCMVSTVEKIHPIGLEEVGSRMIQ